jgi:hypothetical protein
LASKNKLKILLYKKYSSHIIHSIHKTKVGDLMKSLVFIFALAALAGCGEEEDTAGDTAVDTSQEETD